VAALPLEAPRPLPSGLHAVASAITGRDRAPLFTTGPATRNALAAAGALGATTGTVVHLPSAPAASASAASAMSAVLAHELMHTRSPVRRPRFFLGGAGALLDDDERHALDAGRQVAAGDHQAAGIVGGLPVGGGMGAVGDVATRAAKAAVLEASASPLGALSSAGPLGALSSGSPLGALSSAGAPVVEAARAAAGEHEVASTAVKTDRSAAGVDPDQIVAMVEARLLREIERRGGRWAGMF
jgi:hypothetical protein